MRARIQRLRERWDTITDTLIYRFAHPKRRP